MRRELVFASELDAGDLVAVPSQYNPRDSVKVALAEWDDTSFSDGPVVWLRFDYGFSRTFWAKPETRFVRVGSARDDAQREVASSPRGAVSGGACSPRSSHPTSSEDPGVPTSGATGAGRLTSVSAASDSRPSLLVTGNNPSRTR